MTYQIIIPESVYVELNEAALYYESKQKNLGVSFVLNWESSMDQLKKAPYVISKKTQRITEYKNNTLPISIDF